MSRLEQFIEQYVDAICEVESEVLCFDNAVDEEDPMMDIVLGFANEQDA
jgi:hypothetical protein